MAQFETCVSYVLEHEGGLTENDSDPGGITNFGISLRFLREVAPETLKRFGIFKEVSRQTIIDLTLDQAKGLYYSEFWLHAPFDKIQNSILAEYIFDMSVNHGLAQATKLTQRACCAAQKDKDYLKDDGIFGSVTLSAVNRASFTLIPALIATRAGFFRQLTAAKPQLDVFLEGWLNRAFDVSF